MSILANVRRCNRDQCGLPAKWQIALRVWGVGHKEKPREPDVRALTGMCVCNKHKLDTRASDLLDAAGKSALTVKLAESGFPMPDFPATEIEWVELRTPKQVNPNSWANFKVIDNAERREHQCHFDGCDSEAVWDAHLIIMGTDIHCETTIRVCDRHQNAAAAYLLNDSNRDNLLKLLRENNIDVDVRNVRVAFGRWEKQH